MGLGATASLPRRDPDPTPWSCRTEWREKSRYALSTRACRRACMSSLVGHLTRQCVHAPQCGSGLESGAVSEMVSKPTAAQVDAYETKSRAWAGQVPDVSPLLASRRASRVCAPLTVPRASLQGRGMTLMVYTDGHVHSPAMAERR